MRFYSFFVILAPLLFGSSLALHIDHAGNMLARSGEAATEKILPFQENRVEKIEGDLLAKRELAVIRGLLQTRQFFCPGGYGICSGNKCCPIGGDCCPIGCCNPGRFCFAGGCCSRSDTTCEGNSCCAPGTHCCKGGGCCKNSQNCVRGGCCPIGKTCVGGGGGIPPPPPPPPPPHTTTIKAPPPPPPRTTTHTHTTTSTHTSTSTHSSVITTTSHSQQAAPPPSQTQPPSARPVPNTGEASVAYACDDTRIVYTSGWTTTSSNCTSKSRRTTVALESFTLIVASASRVYLSIDIVSVQYAIYVNDVIMPAGSNAAKKQSCDYVPLVLSGSTTNINVTVVVIGQTKSANQKRQNSGDWSFQLNEVLTFGSGGSSRSISDSSAAANPSTTAGPPPPNGAATLTVTCFQIILATLLTAFVMI